MANQDNKTLAKTWAIIVPIIVIIVAALMLLAPISQAPGVELSDFNDNGLEVEALALFAAGSGGNKPALYTAPGSKWPVSGAKLSGGTSLGTPSNQADIVRVLYLTNQESRPTLSINDADSLNMSAYFGPSGSGRDLEIHVQTSTDTEKFPDSKTHSAGSNYVTFHMPSRASALISGIADGEQFILAMTRPSTNATPTSTPTPTPTPDTATPPTVTPTPTLVPTLVNPISDRSATTGYVLDDIPKIAILKTSDPAIYQKLTTLPWTSGYLTETEYEIARQLGRMTGQTSGETDCPYVAPTPIPTPVNSESGLRPPPLPWNRCSSTLYNLLEMPFLQQPQEMDHKAIETLKAIGTTKRTQALQNQRLTGGITDELAPLVTALGSIIHNDGITNIETLLDTNQFTTITAVINLPIAGQTALSVIANASVAGFIKQRSIWAMQKVEDFMEDTMKTMHSVVFYDQTRRGPSYYEPNFIALSNGSHQTINHEFAHDYWHGNTSWIDEGMAEIMGYGIRQKPEPYENRCGDKHSILEAIRDPTVAHNNYCKYVLSQTFFYALSQTLGETEFRAKAKEMYLTSRAANSKPWDPTAGKTLNIEDVITHFGTTEEARLLINAYYNGPAPASATLTLIPPPRPVTCSTNSDCSRSEHCRQYDNICVVGSRPTPTVTPTPTPTPTPLPPLGKPSGLGATVSSTPGQVSIQWTPGANATQHWIIGYKGEQQVVWGKTSSMSSSNINGLESGETHSFAISAGRENREWSAWTSYVRVTPN